MENPDFFSFSGADFLMPQEEMIEVAKKQQRLYIGIPKETSLQEKRIGLVPDSIDLLVKNGHEVVVESGAGEGANFSDKDFSEAGAKICYDTKEVYQADIILKVAPPTMDELNLLKYKQTIISALQIKIQDKAYFQKLMEKKITALAYESIQDDRGMYLVVRSMSEIAGNASILIAAEYLSNVNGGKGLMMGGIAGVSPTEIVVLGAGTVGEFATRSALGLGASVKVFDSSISKLRRFQLDLNTRIFTSVVQPKVLEKALTRADVVIGAVRTSNGRTPCVVSEDMVSKMKPGSVIVDISIDQGGCFETSEVTSHRKPVFEKYGVIHYCVPNIASRVARTASYALSNIFVQILMDMGEEGGVKPMLRKRSHMRSSAYVYCGSLTHKGIGEWFGLPYREINLLLAAM